MAATSRRRSILAARILLAVGALAAACLFVPEGPGRADAQVLVPEWSHVAYDPFPLAPAAEEPVLTREMVDDVDALFVADPFLFHENGVWTMFFEALVGVGRICYATSPDAFHWTYDGIVLNVIGHFSFPHVFKWDGSYFMTVESAGQQAVKLFKASAFPTAWGEVATLVAGRRYVDPMIFRVQETWYMFTSVGGTCYLFYSKHLDSGWREHPRSPILVERPGKARSGGTSFVYRGDQLLRLAQKDDVTYGEAVRVFAVSRLDTLDYAEHEIEMSPILSGDGTGWNARGMHQCDAWWDGTRWIAAVDGVDADGIWSIGIYASPDMAGGERPDPRGGEGAGIEIVLPNPYTAGAPILCSGAAASSPASLRLFDASGRLIRDFSADARLSRDEVFSWNGLDDGGGRVPSGVYLLRIGTDRMTEAKRFTLIR